MNPRRLFPTLKIHGPNVPPSRISPRRNSILGICYERHEGVAEDWVEAYKWLLLAARQGNEAAKKYMTGPESTEMWSKMLTPEQIAQGQKRAREFKPR
jgi:TPR repeat protein